MAQRQIVLYPLHDNEDYVLSVAAVSPQYVAHKTGEDAVLILDGYWRDSEAVTISGLDRIDRLIEALQDAKKWMGHDQ